MEETDIEMSGEYEQKLKYKKNYWEVKNFIFMYNIVKKMSKKSNVR